MNIFLIYPKNTIMKNDKLNETENLQMKEMENYKNANDKQKLSSFRREESSTGGERGTHRGLIFSIGIFILIGIVGILGLLNLNNNAKISVANAPLASMVETSVNAGLQSNANQNENLTSIKNNKFEFGAFNKTKEKNIMASTIIDKNMYQTEIVKGGWLTYGFDKENAKKVYILKSEEDVKKHIFKMRTELEKDTAKVEPGYYDKLQKQIEAEYAKYDNTFFAKNNLVVASIQNGSGSSKFDFHELRLNSGELTATISKKPSMIATMDFVSHALVLEVSKDVKFDKFSIDLQKPQIEPNGPAFRKPMSF
jgi:predicted DNA-binding transcriptional regulator